MNAFEKMLLQPTLSAAISSERRSSSKGDQNELTPLGRFLSRLTMPPFSSFRRLQRGFYSQYPDYDRKVPPLRPNKLSPTKSASALKTAASLNGNQRHNSKYKPIIEKVASKAGPLDEEEIEEDDDSTDGLEVDESIRSPALYRLDHKKYRVLDENEYPETIEDNTSYQDQDYLRAPDVINYMKQQKIDYVFEPMERSTEYHELRRTIPSHMFNKLNQHLLPGNQISAQSRQSIRRV